MKKILLGLAMLSLFGCIGPGVNSELKNPKKGFFPTVEGKNLQGTNYLLPKDFSGKVNVVILAFERSQQQDVNTWFVPLQKLSGQYNDLNFYEVPVITTYNFFYRLWINNGMKFGIHDGGVHRRTIVVYTDQEAFLKALETDPHSIYLLVLDQSGKILWQTEGSYSSAKEEELQDQIKQVFVK